MHIEESWLNRPAHVCTRSGYRQEGKEQSILGNVNPLRCVGVF